MDLTNYRNQKIELHNLFLNFIDDDNDESNFQISLISSFLFRNTITGLKTFWRK